MSGVQAISFAPSDFKDQGLQTFNDWVSKVVTELNRLAGQLGTISIANDIDMQGHAILNLGAPVDATKTATAALTPTAAEPHFGAAAIKKQVEATGNTIMQSTRRLGDTVQQENFSTFLNATGSTPPSTNTTSFFAPTPPAGMLTAGFNPGQIFFADTKTFIPFALSIHVFTPPPTGIAVYYYYVNYKKPDNTLKFVGPFADDNSKNQMQANTDGRVYVGKVIVSPGSITGGAGADSGVNAGCTEIGTSLEFPADSSVNVRIEPCSDWIEVTFENGEVLALAYGTLLGMFMKVDTDDLYAARRNGRMGRIVLRRRVERQSYKQVVTVSPDGTYWAGHGQWLLHNLKPK